MKFSYFVIWQLEWWLEFCCCCFSTRLLMWAGLGFFVVLLARQNLGAQNWDQFEFEFSWGGVRGNSGHSSDSDREINDSFGPRLDACVKSRCTLKYFFLQTDRKNTENTAFAVPTSHFSPSLHNALLSGLDMRLDKSKSCSLTRITRANKSWYEPKPRGNVASYSLHWPTASAIDPLSGGSLSLGVACSAAYHLVRREKSCWETSTSLF